MMKTFYTVINNNGRIQAMFKDEKNAKKYKDCHFLDNYQIVESNFDDNDICEPFNYVFIVCMIYLNGINSSKHISIHFDFCRECLKTKEEYKKDFTDITICNKNNLQIILNRKLPETCDKLKIKREYTELLQELKEEILSLLLEQNITNGISDYQSNKAAKQNILKAIENKLYIKVE